MTAIATPIADVDTAPRRVGRRLLGQGSWALADQALFSASNWLLQVLLVNWLASEHEFGAFVVGFGWFLLVATVHNAVVLEPLLVYGPRRYAGRMGRYVGSLATMSVSLATAGGAVLAAVAVGYTVGGEEMGANALWSFAAAAPFILLLWTMRKSCYAEVQPRKAALACGGYMVLMLGGMFTAHRLGVLSVPVAVGVMAFASITAAGWLAWRQRAATPGRPMLREAVGDHWRYGRWALLSGLVIVLPEQIYYMVLPMMHGQQGYADAGALRAIQNLFQPLLQMITALMSLLVPLYVRQRNVADLRRMMWLAVLGLCGVPLAWAVFVAAAHGPLIQFLYHGLYADKGSLVWLLGLVPVCYGFTAARGGVLASRERPDLIFASSAAGGVFTVTGGLLLAHLFGLWGIAVAWVISASLGALLTGLFTHRLLRREAAEAESTTGEDLQ